MTGVPRLGFGRPAREGPPGQLKNTRLKGPLRGQDFLQGSQRRGSTSARGRSPEREDAETRNVQVSRPIPEGKTRDSVRPDAKTRNVQIGQKRAILEPWLPRRN